MNIISRKLSRRRFAIVGALREIVSSRGRFSAGGAESGSVLPRNKACHCINAMDDTRSSMISHDVRLPAGNPVSLCTNSDDNFDSSRKPTEIGVDMTQSCGCFNETINELRVSSIISSKQQHDFAISQSSSISEAIVFLTESNLPSALVNDEAGLLAGILTSRDILRYIYSQGETNGMTGQSKALSAPILHAMTKKEKLIYCSPTDSITRCREIMFQLKIRNMPVLDRGEVVGIVTIKDLADSSFSLSETGGKKGFILNVTGRKGIPGGTKVINSKNITKQMAKPQLLTNFGAFAMPDPYKTADNVASSRRQYGAQALNEDLNLCEDAHFITKVDGITPESPALLYMCVADGVGSWRKYGVDPRRFSHGLTKNALDVIESDVQQRSLLRDMGGWMKGDGGSKAIHPLDVIVDAWNLTLSERVVGSSTICVAAIDMKRNQLSYANIGDGGLMVVRHIDPETAGYSRERQQPRHSRSNEFKIAYLSQQQLRTFNLPYQLGFSDIPEFQGNFETPNDADTASIALLPGDIIVLGSDGLFDNLELNQIVEEISLWEKTWFPSEHGTELLKPSATGEQAVQALAKQLVLKAREYSLDTERDSPFALLAKENDILWGGGMPDDTTVLVARVYQVSSN